MILTTEAALIIAHDAGFRDYNLIAIVSIGHAESGLDTDAKGHNPPSNDCPNGSIDRGWLQINDCYHEDVSNECAYNAECAARSALNIVEHGRGLREWSSYVAGTYAAFVRQVTEIAASLRLIGPVVTSEVNLVSLDVPREWISEVSAKVGIADPLADAAPVSTPDVRTYTVEQGDTLSGIAHKLANDENLWPQLYQANTSVIGADPNMIIPGQVLTIPANWPNGGA